MSSIKWLLALFLALAWMAGAALAGPLADGKVAYDRGDYATALKLWRPLAEQGMAEAQYDLGYIYAKGEGVPQDYAEAMAWYRKAADQDYAGAQFNLGIMYLNGLGVPNNAIQAYMWFSLAAAKKHEKAIFYKTVLEKYMGTTPLAEARRLAAEWKPKGLR